MKFEPKTLDFELSPYTGLTREGWLEAGIYLLEGVFRNIDDFEKPVVMPRKETEITYPHLRDPEEQQKTQRLAEVFEGLTRTFFIAAPVIHNLPDLKVCGYSMAEYYKIRCFGSVPGGMNCLWEPMRISWRSQEPRIPSGPFSRPWRPVPW